MINHLTMRYYLTGILMPLLTLFFFSCKKSPADGGPYTFHNKMREPVNLSLYKTQDDYTHSRNALLSIRIPAQSNYTWRYTGGDGVFDKDALLYLDWHTDDYNYSNWYYFRSATAATLDNDPQYRFTRKQLGLTDYYIHGSDYSQLRATLIKGNAPEITWKACNAFRNGSRKSIWDSLSAKEQDFEITLRKDLSFRIKAGTEVAEGEEFFFYMHRGGEQEWQYADIPPVYFQPSQIKYSERIYYYPDSRTVSDSLFISFQGLYNYVLARK